MILLALILAAAQSSDPRDQQWIYREQQGDGQHRPTAVFLSWDYGHVIFQASCDTERPDTLRLRYFPDSSIGARDRNGHVALDPVPAIVLKRGARSLTMETGDDWDAGEAEPLHRLALACDHAER